MIPRDEPIECSSLLSFGKNLRRVFTSHPSCSIGVGGKSFWDLPLVFSIIVLGIDEDLNFIYNVRLSQYEINLLECSIPVDGFRVLGSQH